MCLFFLYPVEPWFVFFLSHFYHGVSLVSSQIHISILPFFCSLLAFCLDEFFFDRTNKCICSLCKSSKHLYVCIMEFVSVTSITTVGSNLAVGANNNINTFFFYSIPYDLLFTSNKEKEKKFDWLCVSPVVHHNQHYFMLLKKRK